MTKEVGGPGGRKEQVVIDFRSESQGLCNLVRGIAEGGNVDHFVCTERASADIRSTFSPVCTVEAQVPAIQKRLIIAKALADRQETYELVVVTRFDLYMMFTPTIDHTKTNFVSRITPSGDALVCDNFMVFPFTKLPAYIDALQQISSGRIHGPGMHRICSSGFGREAHFLNDECTEVWRLVSYWIRPGTRRPFLRRWRDYTEGYTYIYDVRQSTLVRHGDRLTVTGSTDLGAFWGQLCAQGKRRVAFTATSDKDTVLTLLKRRGQFCCRGMGLKHSEFKYPPRGDQSHTVDVISLKAGEEVLIDVVIDFQWAVAKGDVGSGFWIVETSGCVAVEFRVIEV